MVELGMDHDALWRGGDTWYAFETRAGYGVEAGWFTRTAWRLDYGREISGADGSADFFSSVQVGSLLNVEYGIGFDVEIVDWTVLDFN